MMATPLPQDPARNTVDSYRNTSGPCSTFRPAKGPSTAVGAGPSARPSPKE